jgi:hypothetical protein
VTDQLAGDRLSGKTRFVMVLALVVDSDGRVIHGQILDPGGRPPLAFAGLASLSRVVERWLDGAAAGSQRSGPEPAGPGPGPG